jgi:hypothetical protein
MEVKVDPNLYLALHELINVKADLKDIIHNASTTAQVIMNQVIETDDDANASGAPQWGWKWDPVDPGRRTETNVMQESIVVRERGDETFVGWEDPEAYIVGQDIGWGSKGKAARPAGAIYSSVKGAHFLKKGYEAARTVVGVDCALLKGLFTRPFSHPRTVGGRK